ncbi:hypothetical protein FQN54_001271 [Arachnomyces sp. PD_36]|nr:hypothetical protein FQN54_001271 [Arachnomyces sp. PD_36]
MSSSGFKRGEGSQGKQTPRGGRGQGNGPPRGGGQGKGSQPGRGSGNVSYYKGGTHSPSENIRKIEDNIVATKKSLESLSLTDQITRRPGYGSLGRKVPLWANYFDIGEVDKIELHQYVAKIEPAETVTRRRRRIFSLLLEHPSLKKLPLATNYVDKLVSPRKIQIDGPIQLPYYEKEDEPQDSRKSYTITIEPNKVFPLSDLIKDLRAPNEIYLDKNEAIQAMNIVLAGVPNMSSENQPVGQSKHFKRSQDSGDRKLEPGLRAIKGFFHSVRPSTGRLLLNLNVSTAAFYQGGPLTELVNAVARHHNANPGNHRDVLLMENAIRKLRVSIHYLKRDGRDVTRVKTIFGLGKINGKAATVQQLEFSLDEGGVTRQINVQDYFRTRYNINIPANDIVVNVGSDARRVYIPVSLCTVVLGQVVRKKLEPAQTSEMIRTACSRPAENAEAIHRSGLPLMGITGPQSGDNLLSKFGFSVSPQMLAIHGRQLEKPIIKYGQGNEELKFPGSWNVGNHEFIKPGIKPGTALSIGCVWLKSANLSQPSPGEFLKALAARMRLHGISDDINCETDMVTPGRTREETRATLEKQIGELRDYNYTFGIIILPSQDAATYADIKYLADIKYGVTTLCIFPKSRRLNISEAYLDNLILKINLKLGGVNHGLVGQAAYSKDTIYVGIDVTHPTGTDGVQNAPSIAGVVANADNDLGQWPASMRIQESRKEMVTDLKDMLLERFRAWKPAGKPQNVMVYRDGVSESQYQAVLSEELPKIKEAVKELYGNTNAPKITVIVVGKRHHTRFYPAGEPYNVKNGNVNPGTVVDRSVTMERGFDFFMVAHTGIQGTSRPAHYAVIYDERRLAADDLQVLTYNLCYLFGRATKSVSIVPPAYYADILCERGRCYLYDVYHKGRSDAPEFNAATSPWGSGVHPNLANSMFYI